MPWSSSRLKSSLKRHFATEETHRELFDGCGTFAMRNGTLISLLSDAASASIPTPKSNKSVVFPVPISFMWAVLIRGLRIKVDARKFDTRKICSSLICILSVSVVLVLFGKKHFPKKLNGDIPKHVTFADVFQRSQPRTISHSIHHSILFNSTLSLPSCSRGSCMLMSSRLKVNLNRVGNRFTEAITGI